MKSLYLVIVLSLVFFALGCSSISVNMDYDKEANFAALKTFDWIPQPTNVVGNVDVARMRNDLVDKRIKSSVNNELAAKGYRQDSNNPDFLIAYHIGLKEKVDVNTYGYGYAPRGRYWGWGGSYVDVYQYEEGTLIVDFVEATKKELIWRGAGTKTLESNPTPEKIEQNIGKAVAKILKKFPPTAN
jgi:hypothetical protein